MLFRWAWQRKLRANLETSDRGPKSLLERLMFGTIATSLGGRLRCVLVCDRVLDAEVAQFFEVAVSATVLPVFGFPEAGGLVSMQTMATATSNPTPLQVQSGIAFVNANVRNSARKLAN